jgi:hypothetical protein
MLSPAGETENRRFLDGSDSTGKQTGLRETAKPRPGLKHRTSAQN